MAQQQTTEQVTSPALATKRFEACKMAQKKIMPHEAAKSAATDAAEASKSAAANARAYVADITATLFAELTKDAGFETAEVTKVVKAAYYETSEAASAAIKDFTSVKAAEAVKAADVEAAIAASAAAEAAEATDAASSAPVEASKAQCEFIFNLVFECLVDYIKAKRLRPE